MQALWLERAPLPAMLAMTDRLAIDLGWPAVGTRVRYPTHKGGTKKWLTGEVVCDYRANSYRVAIRRDGESARAVVFRNRTLVERIDGG